MPTGTYTIDATNNLEPLDSRYVADFPAELRAMKTRMNSAISSIGSLTGALMADGTNYMTGKLGIGTVADTGTMLHVAGNSKFAGEVNVLGKVAVAGSGFVPSNSTVANAAVKATGSYGGGMVMVDGSHYSGMYAQSGNLMLGSGTASGLTAKVEIAGTAMTFYGSSNAQLNVNAPSSYAGVSINSAAGNASYVFFGMTGTGETNRLISSIDGSFSLLATEGTVPRWTVRPNGTFHLYSDEILISNTATNAQKRLVLQNNERAVGWYLNTGGSFNCYDQTGGFDRLRLDLNGGAFAPTAVCSGYGQAGEKRLQLWNANITAYVYLNDTGQVGLYDSTRGIGRWFTDTAGNFTAAANITAYSDAKLKHDVQPISGALDMVQALRGVTFKWNRDGTKGVGFIAQELEEVLPELVLDSGDTKSVAYGNVTAVLVEAIKELRAEVQDLRVQLAALKKE